MIKWQGHRASILCTSFVSIALCLTARVEATLFTGSSGTLAASAEFTLSGDDLHIHLVNTSPTPVGDNPNVLCAVFFDLAGSPLLTPGSIALDATSVYVNTSINSVVLPLGDHWAYKSGPDADKPAGYGLYGVGATGLSLFGPGDTFTGSGGSPSGVNYGLVGAFSASASNGFKHQGPQVQNGVDIILDGSLLSLPDISNVLFQYGSSTTEATIVGIPVPEPQTLLFLLTGFAGISFFKRTTRSLR